MQIREATEADLTELAALGASTFTQAFTHLYRPEDLRAFLRQYHSEDYYGAALHDPDIRLWVTESDETFVAYCKVAPNSLACDPPRPDALELSRIYVSAQAQGQGLGQKLMAHVEHYARLNGFTGIVLSVFSQNTDGIRFYERHGFSKIGDTVFQVGQQADHDFILLKPLTGAAD